MSCPDWARLIAVRDESANGGGEAWSAATRHLAGCAGCRSTAIAHDPTLAFAILAAPAVEDAEIEAMKSSVATLMRARRAEERSGSSTEVEADRLLRRRIGRIAAAAALAAVLLPLSGGRLSRLPAIAENATAVESDDALFADALGEPVVDGVELPSARVYDLPTEGASVVVVVDSHIDV